MKRTLCFTVVLIFLFSAFLVYSHNTLISAGNKVEVYEKIVYGEKSAAESVEFELFENYKNHLFWHTVYKVSDSPVCKTDFRYLNYFEDEHINHEQVALIIGAPGQFVQWQQSTNSTGIAKAYNELYSETKVGEEKSKRIKISDYYDYYPMEININLNGYSLFGSSDKKDEYNEKAVNAFEDFFKIPVDPREELEIYVNRSSQNSTGISMGTVNKEQFQIYSIGTVADDACYFTFGRVSSNENPIDMSLVPGGFGIYKLPKNSEGGIKYSEISNVYKLSESDSVIYLCLNKEKTQLLLLTISGDVYYFSAIDLETMQLVQRIKLAEVSEQSHYEFFYEGGDFIVLGIENHKIIVVSAEKNGKYKIALDCPIDEQKAPIYNLGVQSHMDFSGGRLAVVDYGENGRGNLTGLKNCDIYLAIFGSLGIIYMGEYSNSLSIGAESYGNNENCALSNYTPFKVSIK